MEDILLFENLIEDEIVDHFRQFLIVHGPWTRTGSSGMDGEQGMRHWVCSIEDLPDCDVYDKSIEMFDLLLDRIEASTDMKFNRDVVQQIVLNCYEYGQYSGPHKDSRDNNPKAVSIILYLNTNWKPEYGGNTEFYDDDMKRVTTAISPIGGDVAVFPGVLWHRGGDLSRICVDAKYSITYQGFLL